MSCFYQPALRPDQVRALYCLKLQRRRPMTVLIREAVDRYLQAFPESPAEKAGQKAQEQRATFSKEKTAEASR